MKKQLLTLACASFIACTCFGQTMKKYEGLLFDKMSPNGQWTTQAMQGSVVIFNRADSVFYVYGEEEGSAYSIGQGNAINNDGIIVGGISDSQPAYWQDGEWNLLPLAEADTIVYNSADAITPDGRRIAGSLACSRWGLDNNNQMLAPVVWTKGEDGKYGLYQRLPQPTKDFSGRAPQYITARSISADGKTIFGQIVDYTGMYPCLIVYKEDAEGKWSYQTLGQELLYKEGTEFPAWPNYEPKQPKIQNYMSEEELTEYNDAMALYEDSVDLYYQGLIDKYPSYPLYDDYLKNETKKEEYTQASDKYKKEYKAYQDSTNVFYDVFYEACTNKAFGSNEVVTSENGRYYVSSLSCPDPNGDPLALEPEIITVPVCFDLQAEKPTMIQLDGNDIITCSVLNDGTVFMASPSMEYTRNAYVIPTGSKKAMSFFDWMKAKNLPAYNWMTENLSFDYTGVKYDEDGNEILVNVPDSLIAGTISVNPEGTVFSAFLWDAWSLEDKGQYISYFIDLNPASGVAAPKAEATEVKVYPNPTTDILYIDGDICKINIFDLSGRVVYESSSVSSSIPMASIAGRGTYLVKLTTIDGNIVVKTVSVN
ncbi:T9SS type A sorting domain-containing protein [Bacteroides sp. OM05-12]|uniref:T9SS type A sorting domain-containing protein n=1 Tax=Bacteroides sp. OM05-12 TaxID=2292283 RepID=UPI000E8E5907|nr:T9SS type A sorting domain-containing protein [Bacteroides sp. OM05-12]RGN45395.1 T9SS C-terminal target domain-containing protein [Bacteroides sp. OM05-12]